jgi:monoamine oxidase
MARTPFMCSLRRLAHDHAQAAELGVEVSELRKREAEISRRELLKRAGGVGAAIAVAGPAAAFARGARAAAAPRIAIVGGGIAGLTTALTLRDKGVASTVYEAHASRLGGRMHSDTSWGTGQVSEFCGELIDTGHHMIRQLAQRFGLSTVDLLGAQPNGSTDTFYFDGAYYPVEQADKDFQPVHKTLQDQVQQTSYPTLYNSFTAAGKFFDQMSIYDWIENYVPGGHASPFGQLLDVSYNIEYGAETTDQAALNLMYLLGYGASPGNFSIFGASDERYHIVGGNQRLPEAIAADIGSSNIRMGHRLTTIKANSDGTVTLTFDTGGSRSTTVTADHAVLCMSFAVLRKLDYKRAGFDSLKQTAITQIGSGRNGKLQLEFANRYWNTRGPWGFSNGNSVADTGYQNTWDVTRGQSGATGILVDYTGGDVAGALTPSTPYSSTATNSQVAPYAQQFLQRLEPVYPGITSKWTGRATLSTPWLDPLLNTSYSYWRVGQYTAFSGYEKERQGNIHFAGEHCSQDFQGYMEGGATEGVRAASEILADLKKA